MYTCEMCQQTFENCWSDQEAQAESKQLCGDLPQEMLVIVCEDCFQARESSFLPRTRYNESQRTDR